MSAPVGATVRTEASRDDRPMPATNSSSIDCQRSPPVTIEKRPPSAQACSTEASAMPTTGTGLISFSAARPGSPKQASTTASLRPLSLAKASTAAWLAIA